MKKDKFNNKGAALISVLIATTFLAIIATTLLMISYSNYRMKIVTQSSKKNFYETEQHLNVASAAIRSIIASDDDPNEKLKTDLNVSTVSAVTTYDVKEVAKLINSSASGNKNLASYKINDHVNDDGQHIYDYFTLSTNSSTSNYIVDDNSTDSNIPANVVRITLKDLKIRQQSDYNESTGDYDYDNSIKTDIVIYYEQGSSSSVTSGVGDFSFLADSSVSISGASNNGFGTNVFMYGNAMFAQYGTPTRVTVTNVVEGVSTTSYYWDTPAGTALTLGKDNKISCLGDYVISYGDIVLSDNAVLYVDSDHFICYGDIILNGTSALICNGKISMPSGKTIKTNSTTVNNVYPKSLISAGGIKTLDDEDVIKFKQSMGLYDYEDPSKIESERINTAAKAKVNDGIVKQICAKDVKNVNYNASSQDKNHTKTWYTSSSFNSANPTYTYTDDKGEIYSTKFNISDQNMNGNCAYRLMFLAPWQSGFSCEENNINSTVISVNPIVFHQNHDIVFTKVGNEAFSELTKKVDGNWIRMGDNELYDIYYVHDLFVDDPDSVVNNILGCATGTTSGGTSATPPQTKIGYTHWFKDYENN